MRKRRILLADNVDDYRRSLRTLLELEDYCVEEAASLAQAPELLAGQRFDLALVDLRLSNDDDDYDMSGLEVAKAAVSAQIPSIVVTAYESVDTMRLALRSRGAEPLAVD